MKFTVDFVKEAVKLLIKNVEDGSTDGKPNRVYLVDIIRDGFCGECGEELEDYSGYCNGCLD